MTMAVSDDGGGGGDDGGGGDGGGDDDERGQGKDATSLFFWNGLAACRYPVAGDAVASVDFFGGTIKYYAKGDFVAYCAVHSDSAAKVACVLTRTARAGKKAAQGRPLGLLAAWIMAADEHDCKPEHCKRCNFPPYDDRCFARTALSAVTGADELFAYERPPREGEDEEPRDAP